MCSDRKGIDEIKKSIRVMLLVALASIQWVADCGFESPPLSVRLPNAHTRAYYIASAHKNRSDASAAQSSMVSCKELHKGKTMSTCIHGMDSMQKRRTEKAPFMR